MAGDLAPSPLNGTDRLFSTQDMSADTVADGPMTRTSTVRTQPPSLLPVRCGAHLTLSDHERLRVFIHEFVMHGLIPWAEKTIRTLNEQVSWLSFVCLSVWLDYKCKVCYTPKEHR